MIRRTFSALLATAFLTLGAASHALEVQPYNATALAGLQNAGKPVAVHFHADWCPTCVKQAQSLEQLKARDQLKGMTVLVADYDKEKDLKRQYKVRSQSVLIVFKGDQEVARLGGQTQPEPIAQALAKAL
ncbi:thioredoxin family protein [Aquabacterium sp. A3]|uniref:thioredoxin family protein n=1 Tax=Aquabacterium sp. A3 TaxID=3132829 RepID=UPI0031195130